MVRKERYHRFGKLNVGSEKAVDFFCSESGLNEVIALLFLQK
jgi:hypothetical protein